MVRGAICVVILIIATLVLEHGAEGSVVVTSPRGRLHAKADRKCMNFIYFEPCQSNYVCNNSLTIKLHRKTGHGTTTISSTVSKSQIMKFNRIYLLCIFDSSAGENISCCEDQYSSNITITGGYDAQLSRDQEISFDIQACNTSCITMNNFFTAVLPWYDPCFFENPCQNFGKCQPGYNTYTCKCIYSWNGTNCTIPSDMTVRAGQCLDYSSSTDVKLYMKTVDYCRSSCLYGRGISSCKAFEFKEMASGNQGNCTLRTSNSLEQKLRSCDMDLYEFTNLLTPTPKAHSAPTVVATTTLYLLLAYLAYFLM